jgi:hypothetical protein
MVRTRTIFALVCLAGCGTLGSPSAGDRELPANRTGPFRELTAAEMGGRNCAAVDFGGLIDEPSALRLADGRTALYVTRVHDEMRTVARLTLRAPGQQADDPADVLTATLPWQGGAVMAPDVSALPGGGFVMAYGTAAGALGLARSTDGVAWQPLEAPALEAVAAEGEVSALRAPSIVALADGSLVLAYASAGSIWLARAPRLGDAFARVDGDARSARRDPILGASGAGVPLDGGAPDFESGSVDDPELTVDTTAIGRAIWRLYYTARSAPVAMDAGLAPSVAIAMAASFDGLTFTRFGAPVFATRADPTIVAPAVLADDARRTLLYTGGRCTLSRGRRGVRAAIAPGTDTVTPLP